MSAVIDVQGLSRAYGAYRALHDLSFQIARGEVVGFLGPNGAGKTTTMKILTGYLAPSEGSARVCGHDVVADSLEVRKRIGYLPESAPVYTDMRVQDYLDFVARVRGLSAGERAHAVARVLEACDITDRARQPIGELSKGYRQRVGLAQALVHQPDVLILDEPTSGLDPNQVQAIRNLVRRVGERHTVLLSTHVLSEVQATCDRVLVLKQGRLVADAPVERVKESVQGGVLVKVSFVPGAVKLTREALQTRIAAIGGVTRVTPQEGTEAGELSYELLADADVRGEIFDLAVREGQRLLTLTRESSSLEEVFRRLTVEEPTPEAPPPAA